VGQILVSVFLNSREWEKGGNYSPYYLSDHKLPLALLNYFQKSVTRHILKQMQQDQYIGKQNSIILFSVYCR
jgi:hypothetical protein